MDQIVNGIPLVALVIALVEWVKRFGVEGKALNAVSMAIGAMIGIAYWYAQAPLVSFADWFGAIVYGLALGLVASGIYDAARSALRG
ncbi:MAG: hypothetical protein KatS3mg054_0644 [Chloroflexus sp.]|nr:MAG: hypothetical protein KatS3mg054_0644 [Chloroflexus sp.]